MVVMYSELMAGCSVCRSVGFLSAAVLMGRLDVAGFHRSVQSRFGDLLKVALD